MNIAKNNYLEMQAKKQEEELALQRALIETETTLSPTSPLTNEDSKSPELPP